MTDRQGVEIDFCPQCRGIWLDRGELDKIIERASSALVPPAAAPQPSSPGAIPPIPSAQRDYRSRDDDDDHYSHQSSGDSYDTRRRKKKGFLGDLFDF